MEVPRVALEWVLSHSAKSNTEVAQLSNVCVKWREVVKSNILKQASSTVPAAEGRPLLLLPSMVRNLRRSLDEQRNASSESKAHNETFCAAWFCPEGISEVTIRQSLRIEDDEEDNTSLVSFHTSISEPFAPSGGRTFDRSDDDRGSSRRQPNRSKSPASMRMRRPRVQERKEETPCANEWRGFRTPMDILCHFGYTPYFVDDVLQTAIESMDESNTSTPHDILKRTPRHRPTFAVPGATIARPESYCLCVDAEKENFLRELKESSQTDLADIRMQEYLKSLARQNQRRKELQREVLPRVLVSTAAKNPRDPLYVGRQQRCIQFLNAQGSHAVCMMTPLFACGPLPEPVTIILVGIATEDGCFLSGLHHRFEFGHLYPSDPLAESTELSPVCIATEYWEKEDPIIIDDAASDKQSVGLNFSASDDSSYDASDEEAASTIKCECIFQGVSDKLNELDEDTVRQIHHGKLGPGAWHCYVAVFDGDHSLIRVDGISEPITTDATLDKVRSAMLDGLTIGSDHCFGMSLCCGQGSGGEGEGAIAEIAVFQGRLEVVDLQEIEGILMEKHGIPKPISDLMRKENDFERKAQAMFTDPRAPYWETACGGGIPLSFLTRHRIVAWEQQNPVTGEQLRIPRIGCSPDASSSDW